MNRLGLLSTASLLAAALNTDPPTVDQKTSPNAKPLSELIRTIESTK